MNEPDRTYATQPASFDRPWQSDNASLSVEEEDRLLNLLFPDQQSQVSTSSVTTNLFGEDTLTYDTLTYDTSLPAGDTGIFDAPGGHPTADLDPCTNQEINLLDRPQPVTLNDHEGNTYPAAGAHPSATWGPTRSPKDPIRCWLHGCGGRTFSSLSNYRRHCKEKRTHKISCSRCGRKFSRKAARNEHFDQMRCIVTSFDTNDVP
ncbi:unnamed protein product [Aureobasidium vineae]|uniref:C2H2-type domain-containing protein n=1 Tax=Aureobasidium vineae TaxID=2773715 RepID=A0A9N8JAS3_9PEZI|nr:unnamed protein product [Aureobasidium vineae]